jgi:hypothetical protein
VQDALGWASLSSIRLAFQSLEQRIASAVGAPLPPLPEARDAENEIEYTTWCDIAILHAMEEGAPARAVELADASLPHVLSNMGIDDDFMVLWPPLVRACVDAGDLAAAERMIAPVENAAAGIVSPAVGAEWHWLRGLVAALRGDDGYDVERDLRAGIAALEDFGAVGMAAQAQEDLGRWLSGVGRAGEAELLIGQARSTYTAIGAHGWRARLDAWSPVPVGS